MNFAPYEQPYATVITEHCCAKKELKSNLSKISNKFMIVVSCILEGIKGIFLLFKKLFRIDFLESIIEHCCAKKELKSNLSKISNKFMIVVSCILEGMKDFFVI